MKHFVCLIAVVALLCTNAAIAATVDFESGTVELASAGPIAFAPDGVLLVSDPMAARIYAVQTGDAQSRSDEPVKVKDLRSKVANVLGTTSDDVRIADLAVNPDSGKVFLSVARGTGPESNAVILVLDSAGELSELSLVDTNFSKADLPNSPESEESRRGNRRMMAVTDIAYMDGRVVIAGLSNEEFASKLHYLNYPFEEVGNGASVEIFHGAHGRVETRSPIMTFCGYSIEEVPHVMAAYTCTPLVAFPVSKLEPGTKVRGKTVAELGNRNRPLDMFVYSKAGKDYILMANSSRGMMKIDLEDVARAESIEDPVPGGGTAGLPYESLADWKGVVQLDRFDADHALVLISNEDGSEDLLTRELP